MANLADPLQWLAGGLLSRDAFYSLSPAICRYPSTYAQERQVGESKFTQSSQPCQPCQPASQPAMPCHAGPAPLSTVEKPPASQPASEPASKNTYTHTLPREGKKEEGVCVCVCGGQYGRIGLFDSFLSFPLLPSLSATFPSVAAATRSSHEPTVFLPVCTINVLTAGCKAGWLSTSA